MKTIKLTKGLEAWVDDDDYDKLCQYKWHALIPFGLNYAARRVSINGKQKNHFMHWDVLGRKIGYVTDHINGNGLDNRKENLRLATHAQNMSNRRKRRGENSSIYFGVSRVPPGKGKPWLASLRSNRKQIRIGAFNIELEAAFAYDEAAKKYHGEFARLNFTPSPIKLQ